MKKRIFYILFYLAYVMILVYSAWYLFILGSDYGYNKGYTDGYQYAAKEYSEARDKYFEARIELRTALMDLMEYKLELQEKEGCK